MRNDNSTLLIKTSVLAISLVLISSLGLWASGGAEKSDKKITEKPDGVEKVDTSYNYEVAGMTVVYEHISTEKELVFEWDLGDGTVISERKFEHTYKDLGYYLTCLTITNPETLDIISKNCKYIDLIGDQFCDESFVPVCGCDNKTYQNRCFAENYYGVFCWAEGICPTDMDPTLIPSYSFDVKTKKVAFTNQSYGSYDEYTWNFGDDKISTQRNPIHVYETSGSYLVCVTIRNTVLLEEATWCETIEID
ncbi:MAG: PKD domain-containing protein [Chitinophagales bacterium]